MTKKILTAEILQQNMSTVYNCTYSMEIEGKIITGMRQICLSPPDWRRTYVTIKIAALSQHKVILWWNPNSTIDHLLIK